MALKVVYGHTDSIYVKIDSIEESKKTLSILNEHVRESFPNVLGLDEHPVVLEFEKYFHSLGVGVTKNRNAGLITWKDGKDLEEMEFTMTGFTAKRVSETKLAKDVQINTLKMWAEGKTEEEISGYLNDRYYQVLNGEIPLSEITKRSRYRDVRFQVECKTCKKTSNLNTLVMSTCCSLPKLQTIEGKNVTVGAGIAGVLFYNNIPTNVPITDSYLYCKIKENSNNKFTHPVTQQTIITTWYSANNEKEIELFLKSSRSFIDWFYYANTVVKKAEPIYLAMGWKTANISKDKKQKNLDEWF
tara:strand:+ start:232 stop:1134 length:903 start_codon:yes stop_codon:yes gene_type:complete